VFEDGTGRIVQMLESAALATRERQDGQPVLLPGETGTFAVLFPTADYLAIEGEPSVTPHLSLQAVD
jgi:hypothetical protein